MLALGAAAIVADARRYRLEGQSLSSERGAPFAV